MKAVRMHQPGSADNYVYEDAPDPEAGPGAVLVRVKAVALNHLEAWAAKAPPSAACSCAWSRVTKTLPAAPTANGGAINT